MVAAVVEKNGYKTKTERSNFDNCIQLPCLARGSFLRFLFRYKESGTVHERSASMKEEAFTMQPETGFGILKWLAPCQAS